MVEFIYYGIENHNFEIINKGLELYDESVNENRVWDTEGLFFSNRINDLYDWVSIALSRVGRFDESKKMMLRLIDIYSQDKDFDNVQRVKNNLALFKKEGH